MQLEVLSEPQRQLSSNCLRLKKKEQVFQNIHENSVVRQICRPCLQSFWKAMSKAEKQPRSLAK